MNSVLFLDVDGTLVDYHDELPASAADAVRAARAAGHLVFLCTGRARAEVQQDLWDLGVDGLIGGNGNYIEHRGEVVQHNALSAADERAIVDWLHQRGHEFYLETNAGLFASERFGTTAIPVMARYAASKGRPAPANVEVAFHGMVFGHDLYRDDVMKVSYILDSHDDHLACKTTFGHLQHGTWGGRGPEALFGDVGVHGVTKAHAVQALLQHLGTDRAHTIAFGDATVDLPMFKACGYSVAMGNASQDVKEAADLVTTDVEHDGLAQAFKTLGLHCSDVPPSTAPMAAAWRGNHLVAALAQGPPSPVGEP